MLRPVLAWLLILVFAVLNGAFRESVLLARLGTAGAYLSSGLLLCAVIVAVAAVLTRWMRLDTGGRALSVGSLWLGLTVIFEFAMGGLVQGRSLAQMLDAYRFKDGNIWPVVLGVTFLAPAAGRAIRNALDRHVRQHG